MPAVPMPAVPMPASVLPSRLASNARHRVGAARQRFARAISGLDPRARVALGAGVIATLGAALGVAALAVQAAGPAIHDLAHALGHALDRAVGGVARGDAGAWAVLLGGSALYGFLHALGPGHGKVLVGSVGVGSEVAARRLMGVALAASLLQSLWAIALVYGALALLGLSAGAVSDVARDVLAPLGGAAMLAIGALMALRASGPLRAGRAPASHGPGHAHDEASPSHGPCDHDHRHAHAAHGHRHDHHHVHHDDHAFHDDVCHDHGSSCSCGTPTLDAVARLERPWDAALLVLGIASRPCTSALLVLALAWQAGVPEAGAIAAIAMGLGTAALTCTVAGSSVLARTASRLGESRGAAVAHRMRGAIKMLAGLVVAALGFAVIAGTA